MVVRVPLLIVVLMLAPSWALADRIVSHVLDSDQTVMTPDWTGKSFLSQRESKPMPPRRPQTRQQEPPLDVLLQLATLSPSQLPAKIPVGPFIAWFDDVMQVPHRELRSRFAIEHDLMTEKPLRCPLLKPV